MRNPVTALTWECWRLSRRWYLWVLALVFAIDLLTIRASESARGVFLDSEARMQLVTAPSVLMLNFALAVFATLMAMSIGSRAGFPQAFAFRLPVRTSMLVGVSMLALAALCASLYVLPTFILGLMYDISFPLLPVGMLVGTLVIILLGCAWSTVSTVSRTIGVFAGIVVAIQLFALLEPVDTRPRILRQGDIPQFNSELIALSLGQYGVLAAVCALLFALTVAAVARQRNGEAAAPPVRATTATQPPTRFLSLSALFERAPDLFMLPCPVSSPWRAELWLELKRSVIPILLLAVVVTASIPLFYLLNLMPGRPELAGADYLFPAVVFFAGIGLTIFNRRQDTAGYMSAFEGTRGMSTLALASIQVLAVAAATLLGIGIVCIGLYYASFLLERPGTLALRLRDWVATPEAMAPLQAFSALMTRLVTYVSAVMLLACVHTWSVVWGRWIPYGAGAIAIYGAFFAFGVRSGSADFDDIKRHMWGFALAIFALTALACGRTLYLKVLSLRSGLVALLCWGLFVACTLYSLAQQDVMLARQAAELQAFNAALLLLPLLLFVLLVWSYDRLRHR